MSQGTPESVVEASPVRSAAVAFIFITMLVDTIGLGIIILTARNRRSLNIERVDLLKL